MTTHSNAVRATLRDEIDFLISSGASQAARARLAELWREENGVASAAFVTSRFERLREQLALRPYRLTILRSFTVEPAVPLLRATAFLSAIDLAVRVGDFNAYAQEILDDGSWLYHSETDAVVLAVRTAEIAPDLWQSFTDLSPQEVEAATHRVADSLAQWIRAFRQRSQAPLIVHNLEQTSQPAIGVLDAQAANSQTAAIQSVNENLRRVAAEHRGVYVLDYDGLIARHGRLRWRDEQKWLTARMPIAAGQLVHLSNEWMRFLAPLTGKIAKALVVDLDNTLWGGVIGEDGITGIKCDSEYPGAAYQAMQRAMLDLAKRGILLAICSKNNPDDALEALTTHPGMLLRPKHFAAMRINWLDKAQNLRDIAGELNIGIDSLAFVDDNPVERESVRAALPEVTVIELPDDPMEYANSLRDSPVFERLSLSAEDQQRTTYYVEQRERNDAERSFQSKEDFYRFLQQEAEVAPLSRASLGRIAQLTQKTNQFNLTTRRYTEQQIAERAETRGWQVNSIRVRDRFGDYGLVGLAITRDDGDTCEIDTFLLSCRVIGRTVETALLSHLAERAKARGCRRLSGWFLPTKKNAPARDFYAQHGFTLEAEGQDGTEWTFDLQEGEIACPEWIRLNVLTGVQN